jgi:acyl-CoA reductase-like NAD-dependent aldehyde dehydrogenase
MRMVEITNPYDSTKVGEIQQSTAQDIEVALLTATQLHKNNRHGLPPHVRIDILKKNCKNHVEQV